MHKLDGIRARIPQTVMGVQSIMGVLNYFRKFVRGYGDIVKPILDTCRVASKKLDA